MNSFFPRKFVIQGIVIVCAVVLLARLYYIQVVDKSYYLSARNNVLRKIVKYPARGIIVDRKNRLMVQNEPVYDLMVTPYEVKEFDTVRFCSLLGIDRAGFDKRYKKAQSQSLYRASIFEKQISAEVYAAFQEQLSEFRGFYAVNRSIRHYPDSVAAQFVGYINEVNQKDIDQSDGFYRPGDYIGRTGVEKSYEEVLRGRRGVENLMVDARNRPKGHFADGAYDTASVAGQKLISSLDIDLQRLGEQLLANKVGSIVAIEPSTGEVLAMVSSPTYNPSLMVGKYKGNNYMRLLNNPYKPLFIRPIQAEYPPGSIFKVINALIGQQFGKINASTHFFCGGGYHYGKRGLMKCTHYHGSIGLVESIQFSCNTYYGYTYSQMIDRSGMRPVNGYKRWREAVMKFGIGQKLDVDLPNERKGSLPTADFYTKRWKNDRWSSGFNISLSIGQGELGITPLQMANVVAAIANRGYYYKPHLVKAMGESKVIYSKYRQKVNVGVDKRYFEPVVEGMSRAVNQPRGTAYNARIGDIEMCGKTGTVQNPHGENHSVFFGFAPRNNPKIAIAVMVENAGYGATWSAPIASMMVEKHIRGRVNRSKSYINKIASANLLPGRKRSPAPSRVRVPDSSAVTERAEIAPVETINLKTISNE